MTTATDLPQPGCEATGEVCEAHDCAAPEPPADGGGQPCPPPLMWQEVVATVRQQGIPWSVERAGRTIAGRTFGQGPPLYFLNGIGGTHDLFSLTAWLLRDSFKCMLFDYAAPIDSLAPPLRKGGQGGSGGPVMAIANAARIDGGHAATGASQPLNPTPPCEGGEQEKKLPARLASLVDDLFAVADQQGDEAFSLYATSFGSLVALGAMIQSPARIERAVIQGGFARIRLSIAERLLIRLALWSPGRLRSVPLRQFVQRASHRPWFPPFDQTRFAFFSDNTGDVSISGLGGRGAVIRESDLRPLLAGITTPLLLLRCEGEGRVSTSAHDELKAGLPHAQCEYMAGCGHLPYLTHPHRLGKLIVPFLMGHGSSERTDEDGSSAETETSEVLKTSKV